MCGIFGYVGSKNNAAKLTLTGLKLLEYRGYDSWGVAVKVEKRIDVDKHVGKIGEAKVNLPESNLSIGHTRWATHGGVTVENAHPHLDCTKTIAVVHNGIVENYQDLKRELLKKGHKFVSETDTEVLSHLIEESLKKRGFATSVRDAFNNLRGLNAIVVLNAVSQEIIAAKNGSPLVIGVGKDELFVTSDAIGIVDHTRDVIFLEDNQMAILGKNLKILSLPEGKETKANIQTLDWTFEKADKGNFKHFFIKEIHEEPRVVNNIALYSLEDTKKLAKLIKDAYGTFLIACGSASYAAVSATYLFSKIANKHVNFAIGSEFKYIEDFVKKDTLVIPISQSGESIDVIEPITRVKKQKRAKIASIVNVLGSTLFRMSDLKVLLNSGPEKAVVATKSFIAMISIIILTAYTLSGNQKKGQDLLKKAAKNIEEILANSYIEKVKKVAQTLKAKEHTYIIGRGLSYTAALEATLKLKEASYLHAEAFPGGELKHGVIALIEKGTPVIVFAPNDETYEEIISNAQEVKARGAYIIGIGPKESSVFDEFLPTDDIEEGTLLSQIAVSHLLGYYLSLANGVEDPDKPRNLAKSVTVK